MEPPTCQSLSPVYPPPHGGSEDDDRGRNDQPVGGGETEVLAAELQHVAAASEPPHVVSPGGEAVGPVHSPRHPSINLHTGRSESELELNRSPGFLAQIFVLPCYLKNCTHLLFSLSLLFLRQV